MFQLPWIRRQSAQFGGDLPGVKDRTAQRLALAGLLLSGFAMRVAPTAAAGLNPDEAGFVWFSAAESLAEVWRYERTASPHPPGYFFTLHGILQATWSIFWLRLPSVVAGTLLIWLSHRFVRDLCGPAAGLAAAFLVTFSPALVQLSMVCRPYALAFAFQLTALWLLVRFLRDERWRDCALFALVAGLAVTFSYGFVPVLVAAQLVLALVFLFRRRAAGWWLRGGLLQLPLAALLLFLYLEHVSVVEHLGGARRLYETMLSPRGLVPFVELWRYLMLDPLGLFFAGISALGAVCLLYQSLISCPASSRGFSLAYN